MGEANQSLLEGHPVQIKDARAYLDNLLAKPDLTEFQRRWYRPIREHFASYFAFPLVVRNQLFGGLVFYYRIESTILMPKTSNWARCWANRLPWPLKIPVLTRLNKTGSSELQILLDVAETANSSLDLDEVVAKTLDLVVALISASRAGVILVDEETGQLGPYTLRPDTGD